MESKPIIILGAKGIGRAALEIFRSHQVEVFCMLDDDESLKGTEIDEVSVLGKPDDDGFLKYIGHKCDAFVAVDDMKERKYLTELLNERRKVMPANAVHAAAYLSKSASFGYGNFINAGVKLGAGAKIGSHCIIHTNAVIEHNAQIEDFVQIGAGAIIGAGVSIAQGAFIGSGAVVIAGVSIGKGARIGAGSIVIANVKGGATVFGNPAADVK
jgi:sugar O-acyltransferase (sialic acid O-acetyltransferase NeuD family)